MINFNFNFNFPLLLVRKNNFYTPFSHKLSVNLSQSPTLYLLLSVIVLRMEVSSFLLPFLFPLFPLPLNAVFCALLFFVFFFSGEECYDAGELQKVIQMGLSEVCQGEETFVKDPSAQVDFDKDSVSEGCSFLNISIIYRVRNEKKERKKQNRLTKIPFLIILLFLFSFLFRTGFPHLLSLLLYPSNGKNQGFSLSSSPSFSFFPPTHLPSSLQTTRSCYQ